MGANMQFNSYFPGYYNPRNLSLDPNKNAWPRNGDEISASGNFCNPLLPPEYLLAYNKELLKQTMVKHETIFKDQIQELHRLYRRQRELMDEIRSKEFGTRYIQSSVSHSNAAFVQEAPEYVQKNFRVPEFASINHLRSQMSVSRAENSIHSPLSLVRRTEAQVSLPYTVKSEAFSNDFLLSDDKCKKVRKKVFDLQLPADEYIDCEEVDEKVSEQPKVLGHSVNKSPQDVKSFSRCNVLSSAFHGATATPALVLENQKRWLDSNVANKLEERTTCLSSEFVVPTSHSDLICHEVYGKTSSMQNIQKSSELEVLANFLTSETGRKQKQLSYDDKTGKYVSKLNSFLQGSDAHNLPSSSKSASKDSEESLRPPSSEQGSQRLSSERTIYTSENSRRNSDPPSNSLNGQRHSAFHRSIFDDRKAELTRNFGEPCDSARNPIAVQALPCFNTSVVPRLERTKPSCGKPGISGDSGFNGHEDSRNLNSNALRFSSIFRVSEGVEASQVAEKLKSGHKIKSVSSQDYCSRSHDRDPKNAEATGSFVSARRQFSDTNRKRKRTVLDLNMACDPLLDSEQDLSANEDEDTGFGCLIDLNSSVNEPEFSQKPSLLTEPDLDAPTSPENKECSPPRGESDTNQVETPLPETAQFAAEVLVSLSSSNPREPDPSSPDRLHWLADIASSAPGSSDSPDGVDHFEAMTLSLAEAKPDEIIIGSKPKEDEITGTSLSPRQQKKGRARRGRQQRKDFQREILPSLASLSRYEVTEDLQTIGGLMEAAGAPWETGSTRNRVSGARKRVSVSGLGSLLKERSVICWGKVTKRRRGQRYRVRNQQLILSQV